MMPFYLLVKRQERPNPQKLLTVADKKWIFLEPDDNHPVNSLSINLLENLKTFHYDTEQGFVD